MYQGRQHWEWLEGGRHPVLGPGRAAYGYYKLSEDGTALVLRTGISRTRLSEVRIALRPGMVMTLPKVSKRGHLELG